MFLSPTLEEMVTMNGLSHYPCKMHANTGTTTEVPHTGTHTHTHTRSNRAHIRSTPTYHRGIIYRGAYLYKYTPVHTQVHTQKYTPTNVYTDRYTQRSICNQAHIGKLRYTQVYKSIHTQKCAGVDTLKCTHTGSHALV